MPGTSKNENNKNNTLRPGGRSTSNVSDTNSNASLSNLVPSPIPQLVYNGGASNSSTPASEVELSLAYQGTERYSAKSRKERKLKKKREAEEKKELEAKEKEKENEVEEPTPSFITVDVKMFNDQFTQTEQDEDESEEAKKKKKKMKEKKSVQTDLYWDDIRRLLPDDMYERGPDGMKHLLFHLKKTLLGISQPIPAENSSDEEGSESEQSIANLSSESEEGGDEEIPISVETWKDDHQGEEEAEGERLEELKIKKQKKSKNRKRPDDIQIHVTQEDKENIEGDATDPVPVVERENSTIVAENTTEDRQPTPSKIRETVTPSKIRETVKSKKSMRVKDVERKISMKKESAFSRRQSSSPRLEHRIEKETDAEKTKDDDEKKKKISTQSDEPPKVSPKAAPKRARRVSSAHNYGRDESQPGGNIIDMFKAKGANARPEEPQILKYVGEKEIITPNVDTNSITGWLEGLCQFCGNPLLAIPTLDDLTNPETAESIEYCCAEFKYFVSLQLMAEPDTIVDEKIDIAPSAPYGMKSHRKAARERLVDRQRERELERQKAAAQQANLFSFARQMKTIQYSLASRKYLNEGWTVVPASPPPLDLRDSGQEFHFDINSTLLQSSGAWIDKKYDNGNPFLHIFPDGTGCCYYPSGNVAVMITAVEKQKYTYIVQSSYPSGNVSVMITAVEKQKYTYIVQSNKRYDDLDEVDDNGLLAIFEANGNSVCYYGKEQRIRTFINAQGGMELDALGQKKKRWQWYFIQGHVHTPPFHPLCFSLNKYISVRVLDQSNIALIFSSQKRNVRFNVGANVKGGRHRGRFAGDESEEFLVGKKKEISTIMRSIHEALRLPKSVRDGPFPTFAQRKALKDQPLPPIEDKKKVVAT